MAMEKIGTKPEYIFDESVVKNLVLIRNYVDELIETLDVMSNNRLMKKIAKAEKEWKEGKTRDLEI